MDNPGAHTFWFTDESNDRKVADTNTDRNAQLVGVDDTRKEYTRQLATSRLDNQILILGEEGAAKHPGTVEQISIGQLRGRILESGQHIHPLSPQPGGNRTRDVLVHVQGN